MTFNIFLILVAVALVAFFVGWVLGAEHTEKKIESTCKECGGSKGKHFLNCSIWSFK